MKPKMMPVLILLSLFFPLSFAGAENEKGDGTDIIRQREIRIKNDLNHINSDLASLLNTVHERDFIDKEAWAKLGPLLENGLIEKIESAPDPDIQDICNEEVVIKYSDLYLMHIRETGSLLDLHHAFQKKDKRDDFGVEDKDLIYSIEEIERSATSIIGDENGLICYNLPKAVRDNTSKADLFGISIHEHVQQLDTEDEDLINDKIGSEITRIYNFRLLTNYRKFYIKLHYGEINYSYVRLPFLENLPSGDNTLRQPE